MVYLYMYDEWRDLIALLVLLICAIEVLALNLIGRWR